MRVTSSVKEYVKKAVLDKVADQIAEAEKASEAAKLERREKIRKAAEIGERICKEAQEKFAKEVKSKVGLTLISDMVKWNGEIEPKANHGIILKVDRNDYQETVDCDIVLAKAYPNKEREKTDKVIHAPNKIREAAEHAANKILFELEVGKVAKKELDNILENLEVQI